MHKILLLTTGGTIASEMGAEGLTPVLRSEALLNRLVNLRRDCVFEQENLMSMDSSNIQPEEWKLIAERVFTEIDRYDGIIITHGTDTMAYTASALSFMLPCLHKSVVMTGSQLPIGDPLTDALTNLYTAVEAVVHRIRGVTVAFDRKIINGTRAVKVSTMGFNAFESVNAEYMARVFADGVRVYSTGLRYSEPTRLCNNLSGEVFILKLLPGTNPGIFDALASLHYRGIILEAFGAGGLHYINRDLLAKLEMLAARGIAVVVCSQCLYERCDLSVYEVGRKIQARGVIPGRDMTTEAASTKLMWALGQTDSLAEVERIFATNYAGEVSL